MFWNLGVWKRFLTKKFLMIDVLVGVPCIFNCSLSFPFDLLLKSFLYSGLFASVKIVGGTLLWCVAGWCFVK